MTVKRAELEDLLERSGVKPKHAKRVLDTFDAGQPKPRSSHRTSAASLAPATHARGHGAPSHDSTEVAQF